MQERAGTRLNTSTLYLLSAGQEGKKVIDTILLAWPLVALTPGRK